MMTRPLRWNDSAPLLDAMQRTVDDGVLIGVSAAVLSGQEQVFEACVGLADREAGTPLTPAHLFRVFSNTKLITTIAVLQLYEAGRLGLDDPVEAYLPALGRRQVLRPGATDLSHTEPARSAMTLRQLLSHTSGLSYGLFDPGSLLYQAYQARKVLHAFSTLEEMVTQLADLPLAFHPGTAFEYSIASDVLGRVVEVVSGLPFDVYLEQQIFTPLDMRDTGFVVRPGQAGRLCAYYAGTDPENRLGRALKRMDKAPYAGAYLTPVARLSGGGGLISSLPDMLNLLRTLMDDAGTQALLTPRTRAMMLRNQLPDGRTLDLHLLGTAPGKGFGLGGALTLTPGTDDPAESAGVFEWGGLAGTHWWIAPRQQIAAVVMTQRHMAFWDPFAHAFKKAAFAGFGLR